MCFVPRRTREYPSKPVCSGGTFGGIIARVFSYTIALNTRGICMSSLSSHSSKPKTDLHFRTAKPKEKPYKISAGNGLFLFVTKAGSKLWRLKYRFNNKEYLLSLGQYPLVSFVDAQLESANARKLLGKGIDPRTVKPVQESTGPLTFRCVAEKWFEGKSSLAVKKWSPNTAEKVRLYLEKDIYPAIGAKLISEVTRQELIELNESVEKRGAFDIAKKIRQWLGAVFDIAYDNGYISSNPALNLKASLRAHGVEREHHPFVRFIELPALLKAVGNADSNILYKLAIKLLMLTAARPSELRLSTWDEFNLPMATWHISSTRMKMRRDHIVPLPKQAVSILYQIKETTGDQEFVFLGRSGDKPFSENTMNLVLKKAGYAGRHTGHGFRHLLSTELNERGYNRDWIELQLAHGDENTIRATYNHAGYLEQRRVMMQEWADSIDELVAKSSSL